MYLSDAERIIMMRAVTSRITHLEIMNVRAWKEEVALLYLLHGRLGKLDTLSNEQGDKE